MQPWNKKYVVSEQSEFSNTSWGEGEVNEILKMLTFLVGSKIIILNSYIFSDASHEKKELLGVVLRQNSILKS